MYGHLRRTSKAVMEKIWEEMILTRTKSQRTGECFLSAGTALSTTNFWVNSTSASAPGLNQKSFNIHHILQFPFIDPLDDIKCFSFLNILVNQLFLNQLHHAILPVHRRPEDNPLKLAHDTILGEWVHLNAYWIHNTFLIFKIPLEICQRSLDLLCVNSNLTES